MGSRGSLWALLVLLVGAEAILSRGDPELIALFSLLEIACAYILGSLTVPDS